MIVPSNFQLFGPSQTSGAILSQITSSPVWVGAALTGSTHLFHFSKGMATADRAFLRVLWVPRNTNNYVQLVHFDDGPTNIVEMKRLQGNGSMNPANQGILVTDEFNSLVAAGVDKNIGFRIGGDGIIQWTLLEVQLEIDFSIP